MDTGQAFEDILHALDNGQACAELTREFRAVLARNVEIAESSGKASGELTLTLKFTTAGRNGQTDVGYDIKSKPAPQPTQKTTVYATAGGSFSERDPRQEPLRFAASEQKGRVS